MEEFKSIEDILDFAINNEQNAVNFYTELSQNAANPEMKATFKQFAGEEMGHKAKLMNVKKTGQYKMPAEKVADLKIADYLVDVKPYPGMSYQEALILAMKREKNAFKLYMDLHAIAPTADLQTLFLSLAQEESKHKLRFELEYDDYILKEN